MSGTEDHERCTHTPDASGTESDRGSASTTKKEAESPEGVPNLLNDREDDRTHEKAKVLSAPRHIYFQSDKASAREVPRNAPLEDPRAELERAYRVAMPHPPSMPYAHDSSDLAVAQTPEQGLGLGGGEETSGYRRSEESSPSPESSERKTSESSTLQYLRWRFHSAAQSATQKLRGKVASLDGLMGRPTSNGDDLQSGAYGDNLEPARQPPVSDTDAKRNKRDMEKQEGQPESSSEAHRMVRDLTHRQSGKRRKIRARPYPQSGMGPVVGGDQSSVQPSTQYRSAGEEILSQLRMLNRENQQDGGAKPSQAPIQPTPAGSFTRSSSEPAPLAPGKRNKQEKWYKRPPSTSTSTLVGVSNGPGGTNTLVPSEALSAAAQRRGQQAERRINRDEEIRVTVQIAEIICRQQFIIQLCRALMLFGAPTHRLEEYMQMTAKVLDVESQFLYLPGCMIMSFDDPTTRSTEVKLVRVGQGIDLAKLSDTHLIYKNVIHGVIGVETAVRELDDVMRKSPRYPKWIVVVVYGLATATFGPFAFHARPIDMPIIFINGLLVGLMQHLAAPRSVLYSNVFEVTSAVVTSFLARAFGSIPWRIVDGKRQYIFCFSAIAQSSIALILPGFLVLCSSLELQSHQIIAGSIRMVYAIIFSLFLGYGITVGTTLYGLMDNGAVSDINCPPAGAFENPYIQRFPFVALVTVWLLIINQGKWKQLPPMIFIALTGYVSNYFSTKKLGKNSQVANSVGAFAVGILGNLYSRVWHGHAATAILPAIFILVPSGLAATGSLISGVQSADQIKQNITSHGSSDPAPGAGLAAGSSVFSLGLGMIQVAIGITIGLFIAALVVYPFGKRRSGLFSF
ncbi:hypothetical protein PDE_01336 [Penicillium oxalicum 114-2]|uniref:Threonine/serine exporter-like N-terminal domain-containing protein n=1 Tax=Penicillium oxalicum (strain 114-2 / CGMCC 5302) TaxID=933388 RepID=S7Z781_PENO1|nr:hypothetical protein PDE_01336 [Penicillium oxalicum 114-2]